MRLDLAVAQLLGTSREKAKFIISDGSALVNGIIITKPSHIVHENDDINATFTKQESSKLMPNFDIELNIVYEDEHLLIIEKQSGIAVHPGAGEKFNTIANALIARYGEDFCSQTPSRPGIVHRLDKNTSGLMMIAKTDEVQKILSNMISARAFTRAYIALVYGTPRLKFQTINLNIGDDPRHHERKKIVRTGGKESITHTETLWTDGETSIVKCTLETGRTHQIRLHMAYIGHGIVGDDVYAPKPPSFLAKIKSGLIFGNLTRQMLHAAILEFKHPVTGADMKFKSKDYESMIKNSRSFVQALEK